MSLYDVKYLISKGYKEVYYTNISKKRNKYFIKPYNLESDPHFLLTQDIAEYLRELTDKVCVYQTVRPDVIFEFNGIEYAIEVETGKVIKKNLYEKIKNLRKKYGKRWFFVVTRNELLKPYKKLGETYTGETIANKILALAGKSRKFHNNGGKKQNVTKNKKKQRNHFS